MTEITVELCDPGGVKRTMKGVLVQSAVRRRRGWAFFSFLLSSLSSASSLSSLIGFGAGLLFSLLYGSTLLFLQKISVWSCAYIIVGVACVSGFGMGLSKTIRADAAVMLPSLCSGHGRTLVSLILISVLVSGPISNSLHNTELAASSLLCSAQLTANQTQELLRKAASPLSAALDNLREISKNAYETAGRIQNLIDALTQSVRHIARTMRNLLHFLVDIGDICNKEMGAPYRKCRQLFEVAKIDCNELLGDFNFLCEIVDGFMPLCDLAKAGELFCVIPSYVAEQLKKRLATPLVAAFDRLKREFDYDLDTSVTFDLQANSSQSLQEVMQQILEEVTSELHLFEMLNQPLNYITVLILLWTYFKAYRYRRRYLRDLDFDNIYINTAFKELDRRVISEAELSNREKRVVVMAVSSALRHMLIGGILVALDFLIFWILDQVQHQASSDITARAPVLIKIGVNGSGFAADIYRDLVHSFQILQAHNLTVFSRACVVQPRQPDVGNCVVIGFLLGLSLLLAVCGGFVQRTRRVVCAWFHPQREQERICHLRSRILEQRRWEKKALRTVFFRMRPFRSRNQGRLQALLVRIPGVSGLLRILGARKKVCLSCSEDLNPDSVTYCETPTCSLMLGCGQPLTSQDDLSDLSDVELGSSDEEEAKRDEERAEELEEEEEEYWSEASDEEDDSFKSFDKD
ncbi:hypothetical protein WMY93_004331 [Mugilogobius chulae]|uniref:Dendritic cell-specific transmembrane protein-like domain-containing protein n=1 Tax=Mugilogobius chulae TaxID=88201 RepID=A0AAW0PUL9_9GOBI